jgi:hypothetical protein
MSNRLVPPLAALLGLAVHASLALAEPRPARHPCAAVADNAARLACYDEAFGRPAGAAASATAASTPTAPTAANAPVAAVTTGVAVDPAGNAREEFGLNQADKRALAASQGTPAPDSMTGKVVNVAHRATGESVVTLEGGQVWIEVDSYTSVAIRPGDVVTIRKAALGSYMLVTPKHVATRVRRLK